MAVKKNNKLFPTEMLTLSQVLEKLKDRGFDHEYSFEDGKMKNFGNEYHASDLCLFKTFRFEGMSDPADNVALYLLEDKDENIGYVMDVYGSETNYGPAFNEFLKRIPVNNEKEE